MGASNPVTPTYPQPPNYSNPPTYATQASARPASPFGYPAPTAHEQPTYPAPTTYNEQPAYPAPSSYNERPTYSAPNSFNQQPSYPAPPAYNEQPTYPAPTTYNQQPTSYTAPTEASQAFNDDIWRYKHSFRPVQIPQYNPTAQPLYSAPAPPPPPINPQSAYQPETSQPPAAGNSE